MNRNLPASLYYIWKPLCKQFVSIALNAIYIPPVGIETSNYPLTLDKDVDENKLKWRDTRTRGAMDGLAETPAW
jgi:hypothetical protein